MQVLGRLRGRKVAVALKAAALVMQPLGFAEAGNLDEVVSDPPLVAPDKFAEDVSAFYVGLSGAYALGGTDRFGLTTPTGTFPIGELDLRGSYGGARAGWRGILPALGGRDYVYGVEIGYDFGTLDDDVSTRIGTVTVDGSSEVSDVLSAKFRGGLTDRSGSVLYFLSVGLVRGEVETTNALTTGGLTQSFSENDNRTGFSVGIGAEHNLSGNWSITGEYEYVQFESEDIEFETGFTTRSTPRYHGLRFGLNYRF